MSGNTFGTLFTLTSFGESHGPAIGCVVDGCPPRIPLTEADIQVHLDKRRPGQSRFTTQRQEPDAVKILSGVFMDEATGQQVTTGTPLMLMIENVDQRSKDYSEVAKAYRPGHADYAYDAKYGFRDYRGGGRSSARETAARVAAGAIARLIVPQVKIMGYRVELGEVEHALMQAAGSASAIVLVESRNGVEELVAVMPSAVKAKKKELKRLLQDALPSYMLPKRFVFVPDFPVNANGKVDRKALSESIRELRDD